LISLDEVFAKSDYISIHSPLTDDTRGLINAANIAKMKAGVHIVNCARGAIINDKDLAEALKSGKVAGAALDVFAEEPPKKDLPLFELDNLIVTPHAAAMTEESLQRMAMEVSQGVLKMLAGEIPHNLVNKIG